MRRLRQRRFCSLAETECGDQRVIAPAECERPIRWLGVTRRALFEELDRLNLNALPAEPLAYGKPSPGYTPLMKVIEPCGGRPSLSTGMAKKIDIAALKPVVGTLYPPPFDELCRLRERTRRGDAAGLT